MSALYVILLRLIEAELPLGYDCRPVAEAFNEGNDKVIYLPTANNIGTHVRLMVVHRIPL